ncbi:hypothetical protein CBS147326_9557 [Penicillium roqueforti]|nr:hypothetical protein CBS147326_9557 [Penicillium roqueforti]
MDTNDLVRKLAASKVSDVYLKRDDDWQPWYRRIKQFAVRRSIWEYADPNTKEEDIPKRPIDMRRPKPKDYMDLGRRIAHEQRHIKEDVTEDHLQKEEIKEYHEGLKEYRNQIEKYNARIGELIDLIFTTTSPALRSLIDEQDEPRDMLIILKNRFERGDDSRRAATRLKWDKLKLYTVLNTPEKVHSWCDKWLTIYMAMRKLGFFSASNDAVHDFINAANPHDPEFSKTYRRMIRRCEDIDFNNLVEDFREGKTYIPDTPANQRARRNMESTFAIRQSKEEHDENDDNSSSEDDDDNFKKPRKGKGSKKNSDKAPKKRKPCLICNQGHSTTKCWALNSEDAPDNWTLSQKTRDYVFKSLAKDDNRKRIIDIYQKNRPEVRIESLIKDFSIEKPSEKACMTISCSLTNANPDYALYRSVVADTASTTHVCNDLSRMTDIRAADPDDFVLVGNTANKINYWGVFRANCKMPDGSNTTVKLLEYAYVEGFHTNIMSLQRAEKAGIYINGRRKVLEWKEGEVFCSFEKHHGFYTVEYNQIRKEDKEGAATYYTRARKSAQPKVLKGSKDLWHQRMAHLNTTAISKLAELSTGIEIREERNADQVELKPKCISCNLAEAPRQISRIPMPMATKPFEIVYFNMIVLKSDAWNHQRYISHFYNAATKTHWAVHHLDKTGCQKAVLYMVNAVERRYNCKLKTLHSDGEKSLLTGEFDYLNNFYGLNLNVTVPGTPEQNGPAERAGGVLMKRARALHLESGLPPYLEGEAIKASVYIMNRTPTRDANNAWFLPLQRLYDLLDIPRTVNMSNMYLYGCMVFYRKKTTASHKLEPRAGIGYLIGYEAHNIWRIWNPKAKPKWSVFRARDVVFDESRKYEQNDPLLTAGLRYSEPLEAKTEATDENPYNIINLPFFMGLEDESDSEASHESNKPSNSSNNEEMTKTCDIEDGPQATEVENPQQEAEGAMPQALPHIQPTNQIISSSESSNQETEHDSQSHSDAETPPTSVDGIALPEDNDNSNFDLPGGLPKLGEDDRDDEDGYTTPTPHSPAESDKERPRDDDLEYGDTDAATIENNDEVMEDAPPLKCLVKRFNLPILGRYPSTPLLSKLDPAGEDEVPSRQDILLYQQLVGSYLYPTVMTRPDGSKAASMLATHLQKPTKAHIEAAKHAIQYLVGTARRGIQFDGTTKEIAAFATDASYGDNPNRRSSEGYLMKLFGGPIDWRASRQRTVTTSTTEAELLAISEGGKQLIWWRRLFNELKLHLPQDLEILCDNAQTVRLLNENEPNLTTKLRHVDIHHHWLREKCQNGDIKVRWIPTDQQPADGLTKPLGAAKHAAFVQHLGLIDMKTI